MASAFTLNACGKPHFDYVGPVYNVYVLWDKCTWHLDPGSVLVNMDVLYEGIRIGFDAIPDPEQINLEILIYNMDQREGRVVCDRCPGMPASSDFMHFRLGFEMYVQLVELVNSFTVGDRSIKIRAHGSNKAYKFLYDWCIYKAKMPTRETSEWSNTEWVAFIFSSMGVIRGVHPSYLTQRELFILLFQVPVLVGPWMAMRAPHKDQEDKLANTYLRLYGHRIQDAVLNDSNCLAIYIFSLANSVPQA